MNIRRALTTFEKGYEAAGQILIKILELSLKSKVFVAGIKIFLLVVELNFGINCGNWRSLFRELKKISSMHYSKGEQHILAFSACSSDGGKFRVRLV